MLPYLISVLSVPYLQDVSPTLNMCGQTLTLTTILIIVVIFFLTYYVWDSTRHSFSLIFRLH